MPAYSPWHGYCDLVIIIASDARPRRGPFAGNHLMEKVMHTNHQDDAARCRLEEQTRHEATLFASNVAAKAKEAATYVGNKAEAATQSVGAGMESLGGAIRDREPMRGTLHHAGEAVAEKLEGGGRYLEQHGLKGIGADVTNLIRRNPIPALLIGVGVGILIARIARR
jgi:hypothetical protein